MSKVKNNFREIEKYSKTDRYNSLLKATISAFLLLTKPTLEEIKQFDSLILGLLNLSDLESLHEILPQITSSPFVPKSLIELIKVHLEHQMEKPKNIEIKQFTASQARQSLRTIMASNEINPTIKEEPIPDNHRMINQLFVACLNNDQELLLKTLSHHLKIKSEKIETIVTINGDYAPLMLIFKYLKLDTEKAFMMIASIFPKKFASTGAIEIFYHRYQLLSHSQCVDYLANFTDLLSKSTIKPFVINLPKNRNIKNTLKFALSA